MNRTRTATTTWAAVPLLDSDGPTLWFETEAQAIIETAKVKDESYSIQYRRPRAKRKTGRTFP